MDYDKLINDNGIYLYKDDSFNTIKIALSFLADFKNRSNAIYDLMCEYILEANKKYNQSEINKKEKELYGIDFIFSTPISGDKKFFNFTIKMVSPSVVKDDYSKEAFEFAKDILLHPDFSRQDILDMVKRANLAALQNELLNPDTRAENLFFGKMLQQQEMEYEHSIDIDYIKNLFDSITLEDLKNLYEQTINEDKFYRGLVFGNITDKEFKEFRKTIPYKSKLSPITFKSITKAKESTLIIPDKDSNESAVYITYSLDKCDKEINEILKEILNGSTDLCLSILRDKYGLVYETYATLFVYSKLLVLFAKIDKSNIDKLMTAADEVISTIKDPKELKPLLKKAKEAIRDEIYVMSEENGKMFNELYDYIKNLFSGYDINKFNDKLDTIKEEDITDVTKTLKRKSVFMYRGDAE